MTGVPTEITHSVRRSPKSALIAGFIAVAVASGSYAAIVCNRQSCLSFADLAEIASAVVNISTRRKSKRRAGAHFAARHFGSSSR